MRRKPTVWYPGVVQYWFSAGSTTRNSIPWSWTVREQMVFRPTRVIGRRRLRCLLSTGKISPNTKCYSKINVTYRGLDILWLQRWSLLSGDWRLMSILGCSLRQVFLFQVRFVMLISASIHIGCIWVGLHKDIADNHSSGLYCTGELSGFYYNEVSQ